jgi:hypothetical protein
MGSRGGEKARGNPLNESSRSRDSNLSFISKSANAGRNRFFSPKQIYQLPPELPEEKNDDWEIMQFYKEFCAIVK